MSLSKQIIHKQLDIIISEYFTANDNPFIPYATHHILMELYMLNSDEEFEIKYIKSLELLKEKFEKMNIDLTNSLDVIAILKSNKLNGWKMRLTNYEISSIKETFKKIFKSGNIYLFGSRVDDNQKGGDIDLYIDSINTDNRLEKKIDFLVLLKQKIGDQKIDVVISKDKTKVIEQEALKYGVRL